MRIEIIENANMQDAVEAWRRSRNLQGEYNLREIASVDAPVNEMPSALLHFKDFTILEREIFFSSRHHVAWARTSRVDDPLEFTVPEAFVSADQDHARQQMFDAIASGETQDNWRMHLPLVALTSWTARLSFRELHRLSSYFLYLGHRVRQSRLIDVKIALDAVIIKMNLPPMQPKTPQYLNEAPMLPRYDNGRMQHGEFFIVDARVPVALRAQIIRHRDLMFADDYFQLLLRDWRTLQLGSTVQMSISGRRDTWQAILSSRSCWIAQADLWQGITRLFNQTALPCADGECPFSADAEARLTPGNDPNPPCPRYMNLKKLDKAAWRAPMLQAAKNRSPFWQQEIAQ